MFRLTLLTSLIASAFAKGPFVADEKTGISYEGVETDGVEQFLAIRYGHDTGGQARFTPPVAYTPPAGTVIDATTEGAACPQPRIPLRGDPYTIVANVSEDCLSLRIARPAEHDSKEKLPVMVWIHGGGHMIGSIYDSSYNPIGLVKSAVDRGSPVIYAAIGYRLNIFGNPVSQALLDNNSVNLGLRDQRLGLEWIRDHIEAFGGDPDQITVFGEETGASDIGLHMLAHGGTSEPLFRRAIAQSGSAISNWGSNGATSQQNFAAAAFKIGCVAGSPQLEYTLNCMRLHFSMEQVLEVAFKVAYTIEPVNGFHVFTPVVDGDLIPEEPLALLKEQRGQAGIDYLTGWVMDEASMEIVYLYLNDDHAARSICPETVSTAWCAASRALRDIEVTCPSLQHAALLANARRNTYVYELNQSSFTPTLDRYGKSYLGITHFSDVPYVFNEVETTYGINDTNEEALAQRMSGDWASFASRGMPNKPGKWPMAFVEQGKDTAVGAPLHVALRVFGGPFDGSRSMTYKERSRCEFINDLFGHFARY